MRRALAGALLATVFAALFAVSFQAWANLTIDGGREMNVPLRLLNGETLYSDVYYLYGPLTPLVNAALYRALGIHLNTLYFAGTASALLVVFLVFRLAERLSGTIEALLAAWAVIVLCVFKQNGNYIFPYAYAAVYGTLLGLASLVMLVKAVQERRHRDLTASSVFAGLALICKLEFGFAAVAALIAFAMSERSGRRARALLQALWPAWLIALAAYGLLLARLPWDAVVTDTYLWPGHIPPELVYFNRTKLGLHDPWKTIRELINAVALTGILASAILFGAAAWSAGPRRAIEAIAPSRRRAFAWLAGASLAVFLGSGLLLRTRWDVSPLRALPVLCGGTIVAMLVDTRRRFRHEPAARALLVVCAYALVVLGRVILRVPSGGAYGAYLLPVPLVVFMHLATRFYRPFCTTTPGCAWRARRIVVTLFATLATASTIVIAYRYVKVDDARLEMPRGTVRLAREEQAAFDGALALMAETTMPGDYVWTVPEGSSLNFLGDRRAPLRHEILTPGFLDDDGQRRAIERLEARGVDLVLVLHRPMVEFGCRRFGQDCYQTLMRWIDERYRVERAFGRTPDGAIVTAYRRR